eukprot:5285578-Pyramimonas_sp.AAC.1
MSLDESFSNHRISSVELPLDEPLAISRQIGLRAPSSRAPFMDCARLARLRTSSRELGRVPLLAPA